MDSTKEHLRQLLVDTFPANKDFTLQQVYKLVLVDFRVPELYDHIENEEETVRAAIQRLEEDGILTLRYRENKGLGGIYYLNEFTPINPSEKIFDLDALKRYGRIIKAPGIELVEWAILPKNQVMSHTVARKLNIPCQTREGQALFLSTIDEITNDVIENGYDYRCYQPAASELAKPVRFEGNTYTHIVRDGNNRYELPWNEFPCAIIRSTFVDPEAAEYSLIQYGGIANNPSKEKKNDGTPDDVKALIRLGFKMNQIKKDEDEVYRVLSTLYKETRKKDRRNFVAEILAEEGVRVSIEPYDIPKALNDLKSNYKIDDVCGDIPSMSSAYTRFTMGWGRKPDHFRKHYMIFEKQFEYPENEYEMYAWLERGQGVSTQPTPENVDQLRVELEGDRKKHINYCCKVADKYRAGEIKPLRVRWLAQSNETEEYNVFQ